VPSASPSPKPESSTAKPAVEIATEAAVVAAEK
jgi:hypothetical protein